MNAYAHPELLRICGGVLRPGGLELTRAALELCSFQPGAVLLDLGCGAGATLGFLLSLGFKALGVDVAAELLTEARRQGPALQADFRCLPLKDSSAAGIFCECALSLVKDKGAALREFYRVLRPGGLLILSDITRSASTGPDGADGAPGVDSAPDAPDEADNACSCSAGACSLGELRAALLDSAFHLLHERDCGPELKILAAKLLWERGSLAALRELCPDVPAGRGGVCRPKFGYSLLIARRS